MSLSQERVPLDCVTTVLQALDVAFDRHMPVPAASKTWQVTVPVHKAVEAVRTVGMTLRNANIGVAEARIAGFSMFPVLRFSVSPRARRRSAKQASTPVAGAAPTTAALPKRKLKLQLGRVTPVAHWDSDDGASDDVSESDSGDDNMGRSLSFSEVLDGESRAAQLPERIARNMRKMQSFVLHLDDATTRMKQQAQQAAQQRKAHTPTTVATPMSARPPRSRASFSAADGADVAHTDKGASNQPFLDAMARVTKKPFPSAVVETPLKALPPTKSFWSPTARPSSAGQSPTVVRRSASDRTCLRVFARVCVCCVCVAPCLCVFVCMCFWVCGCVVAAVDVRDNHVCVAFFLVPPFSLSLSLGLRFVAVLSQALACTSAQAQSRPQAQFYRRPSPLRLCTRASHRSLLCRMSRPPKVRVCPCYSHHPRKLSSSTLTWNTAIAQAGLETEAAAAVHTAAAAAPTPAGHCLRRWSGLGRRHRLRPAPTKQS